MTVRPELPGAGRATPVLLALLVVAGAGPGRVAAETPLTLAEAMRRAGEHTVEARAVRSSVAEAEARVRQARSGYFPRVDVAEGVQRGDQPVFVFSSLLAQRRFMQDNFAIAELNHPDPVTNTQTAFTIEQPIFDAGLTRLAVRAASLDRDLAQAERDRASQDLAVAAARAYVRVLQLEADERAAQGAVEAAVSDLERARARRDAGLATDADALAVEVHVADMRERQITVHGDLAVARMQLADAVGLPLTDPLVLARPGTPDVPAGQTVQTAVREALDARHERRQAALREEMAGNALRTARARLLPRVGAQMAWELNGARVSDQQPSWIVGAHVQVNLFRGFADAARITEARHAQARAAAERERVERAIEIDVRSAAARLTAAHARQDAGRAALAQARESHRITRDRYENGLATVTDVLRAAEAALDAESRATAADMDVILGTVSLDRALGRL